jgi:hypothetical protein
VVAKNCPAAGPQKRGRRESVSDALEMILGPLEGEQRAPYWRAAEDSQEPIDDVRAQLTRALCRNGNMCKATPRLSALLRLNRA